MGSWVIDTKKRPGILHVRLEGSFTVDEMTAFVAEHNAAVESFAGKDYRVMCDITKMRTLSGDCALILENAKTFSGSHTNCQGSAVLVSSAVVAMQHKRTSISAGVIDSELISDDEEACWAHLARVRRS